MHLISAFRGLIPNVHVWATVTISSGKLKLYLNNVLQNMYLPLGMNISTKYLKMDSGSRHGMFGWARKRNVKVCLTGNMSYLHILKWINVLICVLSKLPHNPNPAEGICTPTKSKAYKKEDVCLPFSNWPKILKNLGFFIFHFFFIFNFAFFKQNC